MSGGFKADGEAKFNKWLSEHDYIALGRRELARDAFYYGQREAKLDRIAVIIFFWTVSVFVGFIIGVSH